MFSKLIVIAIACAAVAGCNTMHGAGQDIKAGEQKVKNTFSKSDFDKADKDRDGTLDRTEAAAMPNVSNNFDAIDTDHDGTVSAEEIRHYTAEHQ